MSDKDNNIRKINIKIDISGDELTGHLDNPYNYMKNTLNKVPGFSDIYIPNGIDISGELLPTVNDSTENQELFLSLDALSKKLRERQAIVRHQKRYC